MIKEWRIQKVDNGYYIDLFHCYKNKIVKDEDLDNEDYRIAVFYIVETGEFVIEDDNYFDELYADLEIKCEVCGEQAPDYILFQFILLTKE